MADVAAALTELGVIESFLRSRYHYPHPIFQKLDALREHLKEDDVPSAAEPEKASEPEPGEAQPVEPPKRRATRRTTKDKK